MEDNIIIGFVVVVVIYTLAVIPSWGYNIYKFTKLDFESPYKAEVIRGITIFPLAFVSPFVAWQDVGEEENKGE